MGVHKAYNGFRNWTRWNISLWVNNDEGLYYLAREHIKANPGNKNRAAQCMLHDLHDMQMTVTPDGAKYSYTAIRGALVGFEA